MKTYATIENAKRAFPKSIGNDAWNQVSKRPGFGIAVLATPDGRFVPYIFTGVPRPNSNDYTAEQLHINLAQMGFNSGFGVMPMGLKEIYK